MEFEKDLLFLLNDRICNINRELNNIDVNSNKNDILFEFAMVVFDSFNIYKKDIKILIKNNFFTHNVILQIQKQLLIAIKIWHKKLKLNDRCFEPYGFLLFLNYLFSFWLNDDTKEQYILMQKIDESLNDLDSLKKLEFKSLFFKHFGRWL